jgi:hypothetical protein
MGAPHYAFTSTPRASAVFPIDLTDPATQPKGSVDRKDRMDKKALHFNVDWAIEETLECIGQGASPSSL